MSAEIVARLTVNASDFTTGINTAYAQVTERAKANAAELDSSYSSTWKRLAGSAKREFAEAFREINNLATSAASGAGAGAPGAFDAGQMRAAATAARERSASLQQFVTAAENASRSVAGLTKEEQVYLVASQAALRESVEEANALNLKAAALERLTGEMGQTVAAQGRVRVSSGQMRSGMQQLGFQISDVSQQLGQKGVSAMTVFSQQAPQVVQALQMMTTRTTGLLGALGGLPGILAVAAISLGYTLYKAMTDAGEGADNLGKKEKSLTERILEQNAAMRENIQLQGERLRGDVITKSADLKDEAQDLQKLIDKRTEALRLLNLLLNPAPGRFRNNDAIAMATDRVEALNRKVNAATIATNAGTENVRAAKAALIERAVAASRDENTKALNAKEDALSKLRKDQRSGEISDAKFRAGVAANESKYAAEIKAIEARTKAQRDSNTETERARTLARPATGQILSAFGADRSMVPIGGKLVHRSHQGVDITGKIGDPVVAPEGGIARVKNAPGGLGLYVEIKADSGARDLLGHLSKANIKDGQRVEAGQLVGLIGDSGNAKGGASHLHWQRQVGGKWTDPMKSVGSRGAASVADDAMDDAAKAAKDRLESVTKINSGLNEEQAQLLQNLRVDELRRQGQDAQADKEQKLFDLHSRYSALIANDPNLTAEDRKQAEMKLTVLEAQTAAVIDQQAFIEAAKAANDNLKPIRSAIEGDIAEERERQRLDAMRNVGLGQQAEKEYAIWQYRSRYHDLLTGEPAVAGKLLGITTEMVMAERARLKESEALIAKGIADGQAQENVSNLAQYYERAFQSGGKSIWSDFKSQGRSAISNLLAQWTIGLLNGNAQGMGGFLGQLLGGGSTGSGQNGAGGAVNSALNAGGLLKSLGIGGAGGAGALGGAGPIGAAIGISSMLSSLLGNNQIKGGKVLGVVSPLLTALLGSSLRGSATLGFKNGALGVGSTRGNSKSRIDAAEGGVESLIDMLESIAEQVGGSVTGAGSVSIGVRKKKYVVDTKGKGRTKGAGVLSFADEKEAIMAALKDALSDGVIAGISAASQRIISSGQELQKAMQKVLLIEGIPKALKSRFDPVGKALDDLNEKWDKTVAALKEGSASAEQFAEAQKLYALERGDVLSAANDNLKDFINSLNFGANSTYSLMDQAISARQQIDPYLAMIRSGNFAGVDQSKYLSGANDFLAIQRQIGGSGPEWFKSVDEFRTATQTLADGLAVKANARDVFAELTANSSVSTATNTLATAEILAQQSQMLANIEQQLQQLNLGSGSDGFIGSNRSFMAAA